VDFEAKKEIISGHRSQSAVKLVFRCSLHREKRSAGGGELQNNRFSAADLIKGRRFTFRGVKGEIWNLVTSSRFPRFQHPDEFPGSHLKPPFFEVISISKLSVVA
jgi:hypothetical protein